MTYKDSDNAYNEAAKRAILSTAEMLFDKMIRDGVGIDQIDVTIGAYRYNEEKDTSDETSYKAELLLAYNGKWQVEEVVKGQTVWQNGEEVA